MCGEMAPENLNFTPHKTVHQAANCYTDYLLQLLPSETLSAQDRITDTLVPT